MRAYRYRSRWMRLAAAAVDAAGGLLPLTRRRQAVEPAALRRVAVLRLNHLGDLMLALPALGRLRMALPQAEIHLFTGPWNEGLAALIGAVDAVKITPAGWYRRPGNRRSWADVAPLAAALRAGAYDACLDLNGDLRHHVAAWRAGVAIRAGQGLTGGAFLLTHEAAGLPEAHEADQAMAVLDALGLPQGTQPKGPALRLAAAHHAQARAVLRRLGLGPRFAAVQVGSGAAAKRWPPEHWVALLKGLPKGLDACLIGSPDEREELQALAKAAAGAGRRVAVAAGALSVPGVAALLTRSRLLISVDTGPAHLAAALGVPLVALFSGTNRVQQWAPPRGKVRVVQAEGISCAPCGLATCPIGNACMRALGPAEALAAARELLQGRRGAVQPFGSRGRA